jgi:hypothetical protein
MEDRSKKPHDPMSHVVLMKLSRVRSFFVIAAVIAAFPAGCGDDALEIPSLSGPPSGTFGVETIGT